MSTNLLFVLLQFGALTIYFAIKRKTIKPLNGLVGLGDLFVIGLFCLALSPLNFIIAYMFSLFISVSYALINSSLFRKKFLTIPLAGIQTGFLFVLKLAMLTQSEISIYNDQFIQNIFAK